MKSGLFKLISTYEIILHLNKTDRPDRFEVFRSLADDSIYRARVWVQNTYNLYPTSLNINDKGDDLHRMHSCDELAQEITLAIAGNPDFITGKKYTDEQAFVDYILSRIKSYENLLPQ